MNVLLRSSIAPSCSSGSAKRHRGSVRTRLIHVSGDRIRVDGAAGGRPLSR
jgi:hypothetical protein